MTAIKVKRIIESPDEAEIQVESGLVFDPAFERELEKKLPEMVTLNRIARSLDGRARVRVEATVERKLAHTYE